MTGGLSMKLVYFFEKIDSVCFIDSDLWIKVEAVENKSKNDGNSRLLWTHTFYNASE